MIKKEHSSYLSKKGRMTLPVENGIDNELKELIEKWGVAAVRDSDGTTMPEFIKELDVDIYSTLCLVRDDQEWVKDHQDQLQQKYLISMPTIAKDEIIEIDILEAYFNKQFWIDTNHNPKTWWEVWDRTEGSVISPEKWSFNAIDETVIIENTKKYHAYTVTFLVYQIWDSTSMYNALTNNWEGVHTQSVDPYQKEARKHLLNYLDTWLINHPNTDIVRFTSIAYHFTNIYNSNAMPYYRDWCGYTDCISPLALTDFAKKKGYSLKPEDLVQAGNYNDATQVPTKEYLDWIDFCNEFLTDIAKEWVETVHKHKRQAMFFFCDHWIGSEPYGERFKEIGFDSIVNPVIKGVELRRIADVPVNIQKEARLYPYFFPVNLANKPCFSEGGDPLSECRTYWIKIRRAMLQNLVDRIGFGGYPSLAVKFPDFIDYVTQLSKEFNEIHEYTKKTKPYKVPVRVGILNAWGKIRSWINGEYHMSGLMEGLAGMNFDVQFINFTDIVEGNALEKIDVLINTGSANTSWSGGSHWAKPEVVARIREWISCGGGFIGVGEPSAYDYQGSFFQLKDILGVEKELDLTRGKVKNIYSSAEQHYILEGQSKSFEPQYFSGRVYVSDPKAVVLAQKQDNVLLAVNEYSKGRSVYFAGLQYSWENLSIIRRSILWAASRESLINNWKSSNIYTECTAFEETGYFNVINNSGEAQITTISNKNGNFKELTIEPYASKWFKIF